MRFEVIVKFADDTVKTLAHRDDFYEAEDLAMNLINCDEIVASEVYDWDEDESVVLVTK